MTKTTTIENNQIVSVLKEFAETQEKLICEFQKQYHSLSNDSGLLKHPKTGLLSILEEEWKFQKHGVGIVFEEITSGKIIDAHNGINSSKKAFDSWRLSEYFESIECSKIFWESDTYIADDDDDIDRLLKLLKQVNIVKLVSDRYSLYELAEN